MSDVELIKKILDKDKQATKELYLKYAPIMLGLCIRYCGNKEDAKDVMHEAFIKILNSIGKYSGNGSFEGWMKRIMVNASIDFYNKKKKNDFVEIQEEIIEEESSSNLNSHLEYNIDKKDIEKKPSMDLVIKADFSKDEILESLQSIPENYRIIFNLFVMENYSHAEIATMLGFDEKVSRTRLFRAKEMIKNILYKKSIERIAK